MNKNGLLVRLAIVIAFSSLAVSFISAQIFYRQTYINEVNVANQEVEQLYQTVKSTAAISAYLEDNELAKEVVNGLKTNDVVLDARIRSKDKMMGSNGSSGKDGIEFELLSPFEKDKVIGILEMTPNLEYIEQRAQRIGASNSLALVIQAFVVTIIAIYIAYSLITRPMIRSARRLHQIQPGTEDRLKVPEFHNQSELGELVRDINKLLDKTEQQISDERKLRNDIEVLEKRFRMLFENSASPIVMMEPLGNILIYNNAFQKLLDKIGVNFKKNYGPLLTELFESHEELSHVINTALANDEIATGEFKLNSASDHSVWTQVVATSITSDDLKEYYQITLHDISKRKKELEQLSHRADYDQLTQLMNRHAIEKQLSQLVKDKTPFSLLLMDLNGFKEVNDVYGHDAGDEILVHIAGIFKKNLRKEDLSCRWGGDEFVIVLKNIHKEPLQKLVDKLIDIMRKPYFLSSHGTEVSVGASMGATFFPEDDIDVHALIQKADQAMYAVKRRTGLPEDQYLLFSDEIAKLDVKNNEAL